MIKELEDLGIKTVDTLPQNSENSICIIRSHGVSCKVLEDIKNKGFEVIDLTCPDVKKVQEKAMDLAKDGYFTIILGSAEHPEVMAIEANAKCFAKDKNYVYVAHNIEDLKNNIETIKKSQKVGIVVQTTQKIEYLKEVADYLTPYVKELKIMNTICASTTLRQNEARKLAKESDLMVVIGSKKSANTTHLANILSSITKTIHIEKDEDLDNFKEDIKKAQNIGVTAGASTPDYIIKKVIETIEKGEI